VRGSYEVLDYATVALRWRIVVRDAATDTSANISSDHYPLIVDVRVKLKGNRGGVG